MRYCVLFVFFYTIFFTIYGQTKEPFLTFEKNVHDFGIINENDSVVKYKYVIINNGKKPLVINNINTTCGCTKPEYSKEPLLPGKKSFIEIGFDPKNRPGPFKNKIIVYSNALNNRVTLEIIGVVKSDEEYEIQKPENIYKYDMGDLLVSTKHIGFGNIYSNEIDTQIMRIYNPTDYPIAIHLSNIPGHVDISINPEILKSADSGEIRVIYFAEKKQDWGFVFDRIIMILNENPKKEMLSISANIVENFENLSPEEKANAPVVIFENPNYNFDTIFQNTKVVHNFVFYNNGKSDLIIRKVKTSCGCTASYAGNNIVKPGEKSYIQAKFSAGRRQGIQNKSITVITNDYKNPSTLLHFKCYVKPEDPNQK